ncbi:MAG: helix-turn-helix domain-containing protein [Tannerella sp.]|jgi:hypothetical protein|nr:helix-turn-helix domain-containing protein [Tannerella sp.]
MHPQVIFFEKIRQNLPDNYILADEVSALLGISPDSAYRRVRGEKKLNIDELITLSRHFNVSIDSALNNQSGNIMFRYSPLDMSNMDNYYLYMQQLAVLMEGIAKAEEKEIYFMAVDIPLPQFTAYLELTLFKIYTWFQSISKQPVSYDKFCAMLDLDLLKGIYTRITNAYRQIPSTEIWTHNTIDPIIHLLDYFPDLDCFENKDSFSLICSQLLELVENLERDAGREHKGNGPFFRMYLSPIAIMNDFMITKRDGVNVTTIKLYTINGMFTSDALFCSEVEKWMQNSISKSILLSGNATRERFQFFRKLKDRINYLSESKR